MEQTPAGRSPAAATSLQRRRGVSQAKPRITHQPTERHAHTWWWSMCSAYALRKASRSRLPPTQALIPSPYRGAKNPPKNSNNSKSSRTGTWDSDAGQQNRDEANQQLTTRRGEPRARPVKRGCGISLAHSLSLSNMRVRMSGVSSAFKVTLSVLPAHLRILEMLAIERPIERLRSHR